MSRNVRARVEPETPIVEVPRPRQPPVDPAVPLPVHPGDEHLHEYLRFTDPTDRADRDRLLARARRYRYAPLRYISWPVLQSLDIRDRVHDLCGPHWRALFDIQEAVSEVLTIEFLSTIHMLTPTTDLDTDAAITFRLGGVERRLSLRQFGVAMGIYRMEDLDTPAFTEGLVDFPEGENVQTAWAELGFGPYKLPNPKSTGFRDHAFRVIHRAIALGIAARGASAVGNVMHFDLFYLHCMVRQRPVQIAERLARYLFLARRQKESQQIFGGAYVTRLAQYFGVEAPVSPAGPRLIAVALPIDITVLSNMGMIQSSGGGHVLKAIVDPTAQIPVAPAPPPFAPRSHDHEAGGSSAGGSDQVPLSTQVPTISETPVPPPQPARTREAYERGYGYRLQRIEEILRVEFTEAAAHRDFVTRSLQILAAASATDVTLPAPPVRSSALADFISQSEPAPEPAPEPSSDPSQPPTDP